MLVELGFVEQRYDAVKEVLERRGTVTQVAERYGVTTSKLAAAASRSRCSRPPLSLQSPAGEDTELGDLIEEVDSDAAFSEVEDALLRDEIGAVIDRVLDERERHVVALRYGLENGESLSLRETGKILGLSGESVRLIERDAVAKLKLEIRARTSQGHPRSPYRTGGDRRGVTMVVTLRVRQVMQPLEGERR